MEIRLLKYFLTLINEGSISKAADSLHITQPTLSRQLKELEAELNAPLFIRGNKNITLTAAGLLLKKRAEEILMLVNKTENDFKNNNNLIKGDIYIGCGETDSMRMVAKTIKELKEKHSSIKVHLFSGNADDVTEKLDNGILDFCILIGSVDVKKYNFITLPVKDKWGLLMPNYCKLASYNVITPEDLINIPLLTSRQSMVSNELSGWLCYDFERLNIVGTYNLIFNASLMVEEGVGYALCLDKLSNNTNLCFKPLFPPLESPLSIVWKKNNSLSSSALCFLKKFKENLCK